MIVNRNTHRSKINTARKITAGMVLLAMLVCGLFCIPGCISVMGRISVVSAEGAYKPIKVEIPFECLGNVELSEGSYIIKIKGMDETCPIPEKDSIVVTDGEGSFFVTITEPGNYTYRVYQVKGDEKDVVYDETVYDIHINVMNKEDSESSDNTEEDLSELIFYMSVNYANTDKKPVMIMFENAPSYEKRTDETTEDTTEDITEKTTENTTENTTEKTTGSSTEDTIDNTTEEKTDASTDNTDTSDTISDNTTEKPDGKNVKTGDDTNTGSMFMIMGISAAIVLMLILMKRSADRRREEEED